MTTLRAQSLALVTLLLVLVIKIEGNSTPPQEEYEDDPSVNVSSSSPKLMEKDEINQIVGCWSRPLICSQGQFPPRFLCCQDRCVDVTTDRDNCGLCGIRCRFNWQCCNRLCLNTNINPFNCGGCGRICPIGRFCLFGLCAGEQSSSPLSPLPLPPLFPPLPPLFPPLPPLPQPQAPLFPPLPSEQRPPQPQPTQME